ncbi:MAG: hypothetical protein K1X89_31730 [Myxococcaceae bacterium]|nr:hypothetical protein [Myxococcaceae bacterium]
MTRAWLAALALCACNPAGALWLRVEAPFAVPTQVDALDVQVTRLSDKKAVHQSSHAIATAFPHTLSLTTDDLATVGALEVQVTARKGQTLVTRASAPVTLMRDELTDVAVRLCECAAP